MAKNLGFFNLRNVSDSCGDKKIISSRQWVKKYTSFKKRGNDVLNSIKCKIDATLIPGKNNPWTKRSNIEDTRFTECKPKRWHSQINHIGSIARLALRKKRDTKSTNQRNVQTTQNQMEMLSLLTDDTTRIIPQFNISNEPDENAERLSRISKDSRNKMMSDTASKIDEKICTSNQSEQKSERLSRMSEDSRNKMMLSDAATKIDRKIYTLNQSDQNSERLSRTSQDSRNQLIFPGLPLENTVAVVIEELDSLNEHIVQRLSKTSNDDEVLQSPQHTENQRTFIAPDIPESFMEKRKSFVKSPRTSLSLTIEPMATIAENNPELNTLTIEEINNETIETSEIPKNDKAIETTPVPIEEVVENVEEIRPFVDFKKVIEREKPVQFEVLNISRKQFQKMERAKNIKEIIRIDHKTLPPDDDQLPNFPAIATDDHDEWRNIPAPVIDETRRMTKPKKSHECAKSCPCKFSNELINTYHEAKQLLETADKLAVDRQHCKFQMTSSEIDFFKGDSKMCNVMIGETISRRAEMRELMDMWQEANEKMRVRKKEIIAIVESINKTNLRMNELEYSLQDWLPEGRMERLRKSQRAMEKEEQKRLEMLEDEERTICKKQIEQIIQKQEAWRVDEDSREEKRKNQRQKDALALHNAINLMQKYIDDRKSLLYR